MKFLITVTRPSGEKCLTYAEAAVPGDGIKAIRAALDVVRKKYRENVTIFDCALRLIRTRTNRT